MVNTYFFLRWGLTRSDTVGYTIFIERCHGEFILIVNLRLEWAVYISWRDAKSDRFGRFPLMFVYSALMFVYSGAQRSAP